MRLRCKHGMNIFGYSLVLYTYHVTSDVTAAWLWRELAPPTFPNEAPAAEDGPHPAVGVVHGEVELLAGL